MAVNVAAGAARNPTLPLFPPRESWLGHVARRTRESAKRLAEQIRAYHRYRATFDELASLDDRQLADIGVNRSEIHRIVALSALDEIGTREIGTRG